MRPLLLAIALVVTDGSAALGQTLPLKPDLAGVSFLVGTWRSDDGKVAETNGTSRGRSTITAEAGGSALLRRDHTELFGADGKPSGSFDQIMMIYPEAGTLRAEYADGDHHITYVTATVVPGHSVQFTSATAVDAPTFRLSYELTAPGDLAVRFEAAPPGKASFAPIASGTLHRER